MKELYVLRTTIDNWIYGKSGNASKKQHERIPSKVSIAGESEEDARAAKSGELLLYVDVAMENGVPRQAGREAMREALLSSVLSLFHSFPFTFSLSISSFCLYCCCSTTQLLHWAEAFLLTFLFSASFECVSLSLSLSRWHKAASRQTPSRCEIDISRQQPGEMSGGESGQRNEDKRRNMKRRECETEGGMEWKTDRRAIRYGQIPLPSTAAAAFHSPCQFHWFLPAEVKRWTQQQFWEDTTKRICDKQHNCPSFRGNEKYWPKCKKWLKTYRLPNVVFAVATVLDVSIYSALLA